MRLHTLFANALLWLCVVNSENVQNKLSYEMQLENILALTANFFTGLYDFEQFNNADIQANETTFEKIDQIVDEYLYIIKKAHGLLPEEQNVKPKTVHRRNAGGHNSHYGSSRPQEYALKGFEEINTIPTHQPVDIILFDQTYFDQGIKIINQYAASLEYENFGNHSSIPTADKLVLYKYINGSFLKVFSTDVTKGTRLLSKTINEKIYILVTEAEEYLPQDVKDWRGSTLFYVDIWKNTLSPIQMLTTQPVYDVTFWDDFEHTYLGLAVGNSNPNLNISKKIESPIYRWMGAHFDIIDNLPVTDARKILEFTIGTDRYLVFANFKNEQDETATYSPIYRYDVHQDRFVIYQRLSTHAAVDVKYFTVTTDSETEHFLLVANLYETDFNGNKDYSTTSILYKFSVNYFVPFQGFELYSANEFVIFKDPSGAPYILVNCIYDGLRVFNYDGWRFVETPLEFGGGAMVKGITSIRTQNFLGQPVFVISNPTDIGLSNILQPIFEPISSASSEKSDLLSWCHTRLEQVNRLNIEDFGNKLAAVPKISDPVIELSKIDFANEVHVRQLKTDAIFIDNYLIDETVLHDIHNLYDNLNHHNGYVDALLTKSQSLILIDEPVKLLGSLKAPKIIAPVSKMDQFETKFVNNEDFEETRQKILQNQLSDMLEFDELTVNTTLEFRHINGNPVDNLLYKNRDHRFETLILDDVYFGKFLKTDYVNNLVFESDVLILNNTEQNFDYLDISSLKSANIDSTNINSIRVGNLKNEIVSYNFDGDLNIHELNTSTLNNVLVDNIFQNALLKNGPQEILSEYEIQNIQAAGFIGNKLSGIKPENLINIREGSYEIDQEVSLNDPLKVEDLKVLKRLNNIPVADGELQVLLRNSEKPQKILGNKFFESVELSDPIDLQGMINSSALERMNPVSSVSEDLILEGDIILNGPVTIRKRLKSDDIISVIPNNDGFQKSSTILNLVQNGLPLGAKEISTRFVFTQPFKASDIKVENINEIPVNSWITSSSAPCLITGHKTFASGLHTSGQCSLTGLVNGVNINELMTNTLRATGVETQKIEGRVVFEKVRGSKLSSPSTNLNSKPLSIYLTRSTGQTLERGVVLEGSGVCQVRHLESKSVTTFSKTDNLDIQNSTKKPNLSDIIQYLYSDCMIGQDTRRATGHKNFRNLTVAELNVNGDGSGLNLPEYSKLEMKDVFGRSGHFEGPVQISKPILVHKLTFTGTLDGVGHQEFGTQWLLSEGQQIISAPLTSNIVTSQEPVVMNGALNGIFLENFEKSVLYTDKDYVLPKVEFANAFECLSSLEVSDTVSGLILRNDVVLKNSNEIQFITEKKSLTGQLTINGVLNLTNEYLNGLNVPAFCKFLNPDLGELPQHLRITGSAQFDSEIDIESLNGKNLRLLLQNSWLSNRDTIITGNKHFGNADFKSTISTEKSVNDMNLQWLNKNYFSLSRNQTIRAPMSFTAGNTFASGIIATGLVEISGAINGIQDLPGFVYESLDIGSDQVLQGQFTFEELIIPGDIHGVINNIDLEHDVVRYDVSSNRIIGDKKLSQITVDSLIIRRGATINGIDIGEFYREAIACYPEFETLVVKTPVVLPNGALFTNGIMTNGLVNGHIFNQDTILLYHSDQTVTGTKQFLVYEPSSVNYPIVNVTYLRIALLEGFLNDLIMLDNSEKNKIPNFVFKGRGLIFEQQLDIKVLSGKIPQSLALVYGVDLPNLKRDIADITTLQTYYTMDEDFEKLDKLADILKYSVESRAQFLHHYEVVQNIVGYVTPDETYTSDILVQANGQTNSMVWNNEELSFVYNSDVNQISDVTPKISNDETSITSSIPDTSKIFLDIENTKCILVLGPESELQCILEIVTGTYTLISTFSTPGVVTANAVTTKSGTIIAFLLQQKSKQGLPAGSIVIYLVPDLNPDQQSKLLQTLRPTRPTAITLTVNTAPIIKSKKKSINLRSITDEENYEIVDNNSSSDNGVFLAITSDRVQRAMHHGLVEIYKFDSNRQLFYLIQSVPSMAPLRVQFAVLPISHELILYVLSRQQTRPLTIMIYEGAAGFKELFAASTVPHGSELTSLTLENEHFVFIGDSNYTTVLRARFEGVY